MKKNVGKGARYIFIFLAIAVFALGVIFNTWWGLLGVIPVIVAATERCAIFYLFKIDTTKKDTVS
jgi:hypothetical protein